MIFKEAEQLAEELAIKASKYVKRDKNKPKGKSAPDEVENPGRYFGYKDGFLAAMKLMGIKKDV